MADPKTTAEAYRLAVGRGISLARGKNYAQAAQAFAQACAIVPSSASAWRALGDMRFALGDWAGSNESHLKALGCAPDAKVVTARAQAEAGSYADAYKLLHERLTATPTDIDALAAMAEIAYRTGRLTDASNLLQRALQRAPGFEQAWLQLSAVSDQMPPADMLKTAQKWRTARPDIWGYRTLEAGMLERTGDYEGARAALATMVAERPEDALLLLLFGHVLRTLGRTDEAIAAYRRAASLRPDAAEPWWSMADIKSFRFTEADVATLNQLAEACGSETERAFAEFALGRAHELAGDYDQSFAHYAQGNRLRHSKTPHDRAAIDREIDQASALFTAEFLAARRGWGCPAPDPIFIVGMPRSGSTLIEQILASHPAVEATRELFDLPAMVRSLRLSASTHGQAYPDMLAMLSADDVQALGEQYLERTRAVRRTDRPLFIDKLPANFSHVGLIRLILPNARVIDVRRDAAACGFSIFRQNFASGHTYAYDLEDIAAHYAGYVRMMALWDERLPAFVHHVRYETLVADVEGETRRLLAYLDLPFDTACLNFFETARPIRTPSGEQVREPINRQGLESWQPYAAWLKPLTDLMARVS